MQNGTCNYAPTPVIEKDDEQLAERMRAKHMHTLGVERPFFNCARYICIFFHRVHEVHLVQQTAVIAAADPTYQQPPMKVMNSSAAKPNRAVPLTFPYFLH